MDLKDFFGYFQLSKIYIDSHFLLKKGLWLQKCIAQEKGKNNIWQQHSLSRHDLYKK